MIPVFGSSVPAVLAAGKAWASHGCGHGSSAGIHNLRFNRREITSSLCICRYGGGERSSGAKTEAFPAEEPESLIAAVVKMRNVERTAGLCTELGLRERWPLLS